MMNVVWREQPVKASKVVKILAGETGWNINTTYPEDDNAPAQETVIWNNSSGYFMFRHGYLTWYDEKEPL